MNGRRMLGAAVLGAGMAAVAGAAALRRTGRQVRHAHDAVLDDPLDPPTDLVHHRIPSHDGGFVHVVDSLAAGDEPPAGRPVVLLHGVTLQWWVWSAVIRLLRGDHRVLAWDMRGHGESTAGAEGVDIGAAATDLATVLEALDLRDAVVVGHSMGGMETGRFLVDHPTTAAERVAAAVFLATSGATVSVRGVSGGLVALSGYVGRLARAGARRPRLHYDWPDNDLSAAMVRAAFGPRATARMVDDVRRMLAAVAPATLVEAAGSLADHDVLEHLERVATPSLVVVGTQDRLTPPMHAKELVQRLRGGELRVLPGIGHQVMQEAPEEVVWAVQRAGELAGAVSRSR